MRGDADAKYANSRRGSEGASNAASSIADGKSTAQTFLQLSMMVWTTTVRSSDAFRTLRELGVAI